MTREPTDETIEAVAKHIRYWSGHWDTRGLARLVCRTVLSSVPDAPPASALKEPVFKTPDGGLVMYAPVSAADARERERLIEAQQPAVWDAPLQLTRQEDGSLLHDGQIRLLAAASDMRDALRAILFQVNQGTVLERDDCIAQARAAYIKAGGQ